MKRNKPKLTACILFTALVTVALLPAGCGIGEPKTATIGIVNFSPALDIVFDGFKAGMAEAGYREGEDVVYVYEGAVGSIDALDPAIQHLVERDVDLILSITTPATQRVKEAIEETDIQAVFGPVTDPVASGIVDSLIDPGGNLTGVQNRGSMAKGLDWLLAIAPDTEQLFVPHNPDDDSSAKGLAELQAAAEKIGLDLNVVEVRTGDEFTSALAAVPEEADAIYMLPSGFFSARAVEFAEAAIAHKLPAMSVAPQYENGVLLSYGHDYIEIGKQASRLAIQILNGTPAADLPVEIPEFYLSINLQTAQAIGLDIPEDILQQADNLVR